MESGIRFAPSLMCMDYLNMNTQIEVLNRRADLLHVDIMDGHFCKNLAFSPDFIKAVRKASRLEMDIHLMTTEPMDWIEPVARAGATYISPHAETINNCAFRVLNQIRSLGCKPGVVLNPATPLSCVEAYLCRIQMLTIMTIDTGFAGQPFIEEMLDKIGQAKRLKEEKGYTYKIQIDGSCNEKTYRALTNAGAEVLIVGHSGLFSLDENIDAAYDKMLQKYAEATQWCNDVNIFQDPLRN